MTTPRNERLWLVLTIAEPFPVLFGHVNHKEGDGPFFAPNSQWYDFPENRPFRERQRDYLTACGYTVTLAEEIRA